MRGTSDEIVDRFNKIALILRNAGEAVDALRRIAPVDIQLPIPHQA